MLRPSAMNWLIQKYHQEKPHGCRNYEADEAYFDVTADEWLQHKAIKGIVHLKMKRLSLFTSLQFVWYIKISHMRVTLDAPLQFLIQNDICRYEN